MLTKYINYLISSVSYLIQKRHNMYYLLFDHHKCNTNKQTNALLSIKMPTMSSIINKNHSIQLIHKIIYSLDRTIQKQNHIYNVVRNIVIMVVF
jgi:hypothetical protein